MTSQDLNLTAPGGAAAIGAPGAPSARAARGGGYLFHPVVDFLCLGGGSLVLLPAVALLLPVQSSLPAVAATMLLLANVINHPHFAHSYQIFYRNVRRKLFTPYYPLELRLRYVAAGFVAPGLLAAFFAYSLAAGEARTMAYGANLMAFLVGWHYVKQGYGMLIVTSVLKRAFFAGREKKILLLNAYSAWITGWLLTNQAVRERDMWGLGYYSFDVPEALLYPSMWATSVTTALVLYVLVEKWRADRAGFPLNGAAAYVASIYLWFFFLYANPLLLWIIPALHSVQYLLVVWRYQINLVRGEAGAAEGDAPTGGPGLMRGRLGREGVARLALFGLLGVLLGYAGFWALPEYLGATVPYDRAAFGEHVFFFMFWIFINVHHYFLDNVIWRKENFDVGKYLFAHR
jgi:hypothetical protein